MVTMGSRDWMQAARSAAEASGGISVFAALLLATAAGPARATTHLVRPDGSGSFPTIQAAITAAAPGDTVLLADGVFLGDGNRDLDPAGKALVIRSQSGQAADCIIDCEGSAASRHRGFLFQSAEGPGTRIEDFTIRNGWGPHDPYGLAEAGAVLIRDASPTLRGCILADNQASFGGAVVLYGYASPAFLECTFDGNHAGLDGAGINCREHASPLVADCVFTGNTAVSRAGGLLADDDTTPRVQDCTFTGNHATYGGGAVYCCGFSAPHLSGCTLAGNAAGAGGAGISCGCYAQVLVEGTIIAFSTAGQAVYYTNDAHVTLLCCDLYGNAGGDWVAPIASQYGENGNFGEDPLFCDRPAGDLRLGGESPCLPRNHPWGDACGVIGAWPVGCPGSGVEAILPSAHPRLDAIWPNPAAGAVTLHFSLAPTSLGAPDGRVPVTLRIHDAAGRVVRTLLARTLGAGEHEIVWDGADEAGGRVAAGIYWCRLAHGERFSARPILRVR